MLDYYAVMGEAEVQEYYDLADLERDDYLYLLGNFSRLMQLYEIKQD
jgi:hypothetical protein